MSVCVQVSQKEYSGVQLWRPIIVNLSLCHCWLTINLTLSTIRQIRLRLLLVPFGDTISTTKKKHWLLFICWREFFTLFIKIYKMARMLLNFILVITFQLFSKACYICSLARVSSHSMHLTCSERVYVCLCVSKCWGDWPRRHCSREWSVSLRGPSSFLVPSLWQASCGRLFNFAAVSLYYFR